MYGVPPPHQHADSATGTADAKAASLRAYETWKGSNVSRGFSLSADVDINRCATYFSVWMIRWTCVCSFFTWIGARVLF